MVRFHDLPDLPQLAIAEPLGPGKPDWLKPKLRDRLVPLYMNVRWLGAFCGIKKQLEWPYIGYVWHAIHLSISISRIPMAFNRLAALLRWFPLTIVPGVCPRALDTLQYPWKSAGLRHKLYR